MQWWRGSAAWGIVILALGLAGLGAWAVVANMTQPRTTIAIGGTAIRASLARTQDEQDRGLGGVADLADGQGMLFVFEYDGPQAMWMKDMKIPLDIIWLSSAHKVTHIEHDLTPETYPQAYISPTPARYVLEVPSGTATSTGMKIGMQASFTLQ